MRSSHESCHKDNHNLGVLKNTHDNSCTSAQIGKCNNNKKQVLLKQRGATIITKTIGVIIFNFLSHHLILDRKNKVMIHLKHEHLTKIKKLQQSFVDAQCNNCYDGFHCYHDKNNSNNNDISALDAQKVHFYLSKQKQQKITNVVIVEHSFNDMLVLTFYFIQHE